LTWIKAQLPGVRKEDVKVELLNGVLTVSGERKFEKEDKDEKQHRIESAYGSFVRSFAPTFSPSRTIAAASSAPDSAIAESFCASQTSPCVPR